MVDQIGKSYRQGQVKRNKLFGQMNSINQAEQLNHETAWRFSPVHIIQGAPVIRQSPPQFPTILDKVQRNSLKSLEVRFSRDSFHM